MKAVFLRKHGPASWLIRLACWSQWSHVAIQADDFTVIHSTFWGRGVHRTRITELVRDISEVVAAEWRTRITELLREYSAHEWVDIAVPDESSAIAFLRGQLGRPYDWTALLGFLVRRDWAEPDRWFCSELLEAALLAGGLRRFRTDASRVTQQHQWMLAP